MKYFGLAVLAMAFVSADANANGGLVGFSRARTVSVTRTTAVVGVGNVGVGRVGFVGGGYGYNRVGFVGGGYGYGGVAAVGYGGGCYGYAPPVAIQPIYSAPICQQPVQLPSYSAPQVEYEQYTEYVPVTKVRAKVVQGPPVASQLPVQPPIYGSGDCQSYQAPMYQPQVGVGYGGGYGVGYGGGYAVGVGRVRVGVVGNGCYGNNLPVATPYGVGYGGVGRVGVGGGYYGGNNFVGVNPLYGVGRVGVGVGVVGVGNTAVVRQVTRTRTVIR